MKEIFYERLQGCVESDEDFVMGACIVRLFGPLSACENVGRETQSKSISEIGSESVWVRVQCCRGESVPQRAVQLLQLEGFVLVPMMDSDGRCVGMRGHGEVEKAPTCAVAFEVWDKNLVALVKILKECMPVLRKVCEKEGGADFDVRLHGVSRQHVLKEFCEELENMYRNDAARNEEIQVCRRDGPAFVDDLRVDVVVLVLWRACGYGAVEVESVQGTPCLGDGKHVWVLIMQAMPCIGKNRRVWQASM